MNVLASILTLTSLAAFSPAVLAQPAPATLVQYRPYDDRGGRQYERREERGAPGGTYLRSCSDVRQNGSSLSAVCRDGRGRPVETSIDLNRCRGSDIGNNNGILACAGGRGDGRRLE